MVLVLVVLGMVVGLVTGQATISLEDVCGNKLVGSCPNKISLKVVGGTSTCAEKVPWNVLLELTDGPKALNGGVYPYCGGVLISDRYVLSAAHCFWTNENPFGSCPRKFLAFSNAECRRERDGCPASCTRLGPESIRLYLGVTRRTEVRKGEGRQVESIMIHPGWDRTDRLNDILAGHDIALLKLKDPVNMYSRRTVPICLPNPDKDRYLLKESRTADVAGFGVIISPRNGERKHPVEVQTARVTLSSRATCGSWWSITGDQICAAGTQRVETSQANLNLVSDSCNGDSGGGLTATNFDGREVLLGIISFGEPDCGRKGGKPGVYTNVFDHVEWIQDNISPRIVNRPPPGRVPTIPSNTGIRCFTSNGKACKLPFKFRNKIFASCTTEGDPDNRAWCSTKVDGSGEHVPGEGEFGYCPSNCVVDILTTPRPVFPSSLPTKPSSSWSSWSSCSTTCGTGSQTRTNLSCLRPKSGCASVQSRACSSSPCPASSAQPSPASSPGQWADWGACSVACGGGEQIRTKGGTNIAQTRGCNLQACQVTQSQGKTGPSFSTTWIVGGSGVGSSVESLVTRPGGQLCGRDLRPFPSPRSSALGGFLRGRVYVCGGSSGGFENSVLHRDCHYAEASDPGRGWVEAPALPMNTSHAAYTVMGDKMYAFGGYQKPVCGYRPEVQIFNSATQSWSQSQSTDPPQHLGGYACAVAAGSLIFVIGGWYTPETYIQGQCKEKLEDDELTRVNRVNSYYQDRVQIYDPSSNQWAEGPRLRTARRNHGCTFVDVGGRNGIMVAGGYNNQEGYLKGVEFLDLGTDGLRDLGLFRRRGLRWRDLPEMKEARGSKLVLINDEDFVYAVGGDLGGTGSVESFDKKRSKWKKLPYRTKKKRSFSSYIPNIETSRPGC